MEHDPAPFGPWAPLTPQDAVQLMAGLDVPWWIAGGWAIDLFLGRTSRKHGDIDICLMLTDQDAVREHFAEWDLHIAHAGTLTPWQRAGRIERKQRDACGVWARPSAGNLWTLEFLFEDSDKDEWIYRRDSAVRRPLAEFGLVDQSGIPFIRPEIALLHKSKSHAEHRHAADFDAALPLLDPAARGWLKSALQRTDPGHVWLACL